jgi:hypothetical protein
MTQPRMPIAATFASGPAAPSRLTDENIAAMSRYLASHGPAAWVITVFGTQITVHASTP